MNSKCKKFSMRTLSALLSVLMLLSVFTIVPVTTANAADTNTHPAGDGGANWTDLRFYAKYANSETWNITNGATLITNSAETYYNGWNSFTATQDGRVSIRYKSVGSINEWLGIKISNDISLNSTYSVGWAQNTATFDVKKGHTYGCMFIANVRASAGGWDYVNDNTWLAVTEIFKPGSNVYFKTNSTWDNASQDATSVMVSKYMCTGSLGYSLGYDCDEDNTNSTVKSTDASSTYGQYWKKFTVPSLSKCGGTVSLCFYPYKNLAAAETVRSLEPYTTAAGTDNYYYELESTTLSSSMTCKKDICFDKRVMLRNNVNTTSTTGTGTGSIAFVPVYDTSNSEALGNVMYLSTLASPVANSGYLKDDDMGCYTTNSMSSSYKITSADQMKNGMPMYFVQTKKCTVNGYTVNRNSIATTSGTASLIKSKDYKCGETINLNTAFAPSTPDGYQFQKWTSSPSYLNSSSYLVGNDLSTSVTLSNTATTASYYAVYTHLYTLSYNKGNYGSGTAPASVTVYGGSTVTLPNNNGVANNTFTRSNYTDNGWTTDINGAGTRINPANSYTMPTQDTTLYPYWAATYAVTFSKGSYGSGSAVTKTEITGNSITLPTKTEANNAFTRTGYEVRGWSTDPLGTTKDKECGATFTSSTSKTYFYYPYWEKTDSYRITYMPIALDMRLYDENGSLVTAPADNISVINIVGEQPLKGETYYANGYRQDGWSLEAGGSKTYDLGQTYSRNSDTQVSLVPHMATAYSATADTTGNGTVGVSDTQGDYRSEFNSRIFENGNMYIKVEPAYGYHLKSLTVNGVDVTADVDEDGICTISNVTADQEVIAEFEGNTTTVYFDAGENAYINNYFVNPKTATFGTAMNNIPNYSGDYELPIRNGFTFNGYWYENADGELVKIFDEDGYFVPEVWDINEEEVELVADWIQNEYTVTFDANGGEFPEGFATSVKAYCEEPLQNIAEDLLPSYKGYTFDGFWSKAYNYETYSYDFAKKYFNGDGEFVPEAWDLGYNTTLYAKWIPNDYEVTFDGNGADLPEGFTNPVTVTYTQVYGNLESVPERSGYDFMGFWTKDENDEFAYGYYDSEGQALLRAWDIPDDTVLYAKWEPHKHTVSFDAANGSEENPEPYEFTFGELASVPEEAIPSAEEGFAFVGYFDADGKQYTDGEGEAFEGQTWDVDDDFTLTAHWSKLPEKVTLDPDGGEIADGEDFDTYVPGEVTPLPTPVYDGYVFIGWLDQDAEDSEPTMFIPETATGEKYYIAIWKEINGTIVYNNIEDTDVFVTPKVEHYAKGVRTDLPTVVTRNRYQLEGWYADENFQEKIDSVLTDEDTYNVYAKWVEKAYNITYVLNGGKFNSIPTTAFKVNELPFTLSTDISRNGYVFEGWYTDENFAEGTEKPGLTTGDKKNITVYAKWVPADYTVLYYNDGTLTPVGYKTPEEGESYDLPEVARANYEFEGWFTTAAPAGEGPLNGEKVEALTAEFFAGLGDKTTVILYARWTPAKFDLTLLNVKDISEEGEDPIYVYAEAEDGEETPSVTIEDAYTFGEGLAKLPEISDMGATDDGKKRKFVSWADPVTDDKVDSISKTTADDLTLYPAFVLGYNVEYDENGGTIVSGAFDFYEEGEVKDLTDNLYKSGCEFAGWHEVVDEEVSEETIDKTPEEGRDLNLKAEWIECSYKITYVLDGGEILTGRFEGFNTPEEGKTIALPTDVYKHLFRFLGWTDEYGNPKNEITDQDQSDITVYADYEQVFQDKENKFNFVLAEDEELDGDIDDYYFGIPAEGGDSIVLPAATKAGDYEFNGWFTKPNGEGTQVAEIAADFDTALIRNYTLTLYPYFTEKGAYTINYNLADDEAIKSGEIKSFNVPEEGEIVLPTDVEKEGNYDFVGWYTTEDFQEGTEIAKITPDFDTDLLVEGVLNLYPKFEEKHEPGQYTINYNLADDEAITSGKVDDFDIPAEGEEIVLPTKVTKEGDYEFEGWYTTEDFQEGTEIAKITSDFDTDLLVEGVLNLYPKFVESTGEYTITYHLYTGQMTEGAAAELTKVDDETYTDTYTKGEEKALLGGNTTTVRDRTDRSKFHYKDDEGNEDGIIYKPFYIFDGWCTKSDFSDEAVKTIPEGNEGGNKEYYAKWTYLLGDVDGSGVVEDVDADFLLRHANNFEQAQRDPSLPVVKYDKLNFDAADLNGDGEADDVDADRLLRIVNNYHYTAPAEPNRDDYTDDASYQRAYERYQRNMNVIATYEALFSDYQNQVKHTFVLEETKDPELKQG